MTARSRTNRSTAGSPKPGTAEAAHRPEQADPLLQALAVAPDDDEPFTADDEAAIAQVDADRARGELAIPLQEVMRKYRHG